MDLGSLFAKMRQIASEVSDSLKSTAVTVPPVRSVASSVEQAHRLAERYQRPIDCFVEGFPVTVFPVGHTPPIGATQPPIG